MTQLKGYANFCLVTFFVHMRGGPLSGKKHPATSPTKHHDSCHVYPSHQRFYAAKDASGSSMVTYMPEGEDRGDDPSGPKSEAEIERNRGGKVINVSMMYYHCYYY